MIAEPSSSSGGFGEHISHSSASDTRSEYHGEQEVDVLQKIIDKEIESLDAIGVSKHNLEPPLSNSTDFARSAEKDNRLRYDELTIREGIDLIRMGARMIVTKTLEKTHPAFKIAAVLSIGPCLWYTFPLSRLHTFSIG
jgi:hypothetical protein